MTPDPTRRRTLHWVLILAGLPALLLFVYTVAGRVGYPYELEWLEGGMADHVARIAAGLPIYGPPSLDFIPFLYPGLFPYVSYGPWALLGGGIVPLRVVGLLATGVAVVFTGLLGARESETDRRLAGILSGAFLLASYQATGAWFDLARVDMLMFALFLAGTWLVRTRPGWMSQAAGGVLWGIAFFAKQTALPMGLPLALWALLAGRGRARFSAAIAFVVVAAGGSVLCQWISDGWYGYYVLELQARRPYDFTLLPQLWTTDFFPQAIPALALAGWLVLSRLRAPTLADKLYLPALFAGCLGSALLGRLHSGGFVNVLIPAYLGFAIAFGPAVVALLSRGRSAVALGTVAVLLQFGLLVYDPRPMIPTDADRAAGDTLVAGLTKVEGDVFIPSHGYLAERAGHPTYAHFMAIGDIIRAEGDEGRVLEAELRVAFAERRFSLLVFDHPWMVQYLGGAYEPVSRALPADGTFLPVTGAPVRPEMVLRPVPLGAEPEVKAP